MAPRTTSTPTPTSQSSSGSTPAHSDAASAKAFIPELLLIFFGLCFAYTLSYVIYRIVKARRRQSANDIPDSPDRGVTRFMNGARLTLNFGNQRKPTTPTPSEEPNTVDEEKPLSDPSHQAYPEIPSGSSPADSSSTPFSILTPSFTMEPNRELELDDTAPQRQEQGLSVSQGTVLAPTPTSVPTQQPFSQRVVAKVKFLSRDRAEAIAHDPKLAPVQGPLRPLSMVQSPSRNKRRTLFGLGLKNMHSRERGVDPGTDSGAQ
ncbi:hypothetical protein JVU11DRAFT_1185 [Chiua virens]|nr:hypothetical protein JVU11DRAFT_1185 [Chiua virens]